MKEIGEKALIPNPALEPFRPLIGNWQTTGSHPMFPDAALHGRASFEWDKGGAFLVARGEIDHPDFPHGIEIFASDDAAKAFFMLHFDERGVSRKYDVSVEGNTIEWHRDDPHFSQKFILTIEDEGDRLVSVGHMSRDGGAWEKDLDLVYTRIT